MTQEENLLRQLEFLQDTASYHVDNIGYAIRDVREGKRLSPAMVELILFVSEYFFTPEAHRRLKSAIDEYNKQVLGY